MPSLYIKDELQLKQFCQSAENIDIFSIDTEFQRRDTYYAIPALVQIAYQANDTIIAACFDAKTIQDWSLLQQVLSSAKACIMHSSDQDFEIFDQIFPDWSFNIRDTQLACALLGTQPQIGYAGMIKRELDIDIDKSQTRTNWLQRPLTKKQIDYALSDVTHLLTAWEKLIAQLKTTERDTWFLEDCERLQSTHKALKDNSRAWKKIKGIRHLDKEEFTRAASLAEWRESKAQTHDRPRRWLLDDEAIINLAERPSRLVEISKHWKILSNDLPAVEQILSNPNKSYLEITNYNSPALSEAEKKQYQALKQYITEQALKLNVETNTLANRKTLEKIARGHLDHLNTSNWRHKILLQYVQ